MRSPASPRRALHTPEKHGGQHVVVYGPPHRLSVDGERFPPTPSTPSRRRRSPRVRRPTALLERRRQKCWKTEEAALRGPSDDAARALVGHAQVSKQHVLRRNHRAPQAILRGKEEWEGRGAPRDLVRPPVIRACTHASNLRRACLRMMEPSVVRAGGAGRCAMFFLFSPSPPLSLSLSLPCFFVLLICVRSCCRRAGGPADLGGENELALQARIRQVSA